MIEEPAKFSPAMPEEVHPALADVASGVQALLMSRNPPTVLRYPVAGKVEARFFKPGDDKDVVGVEKATRYEELRLGRVVGPAPFVGEPFVYVWLVYVDRFGRCIAGPRMIHYYDPKEVTDE
jgi:hypothetical protein